MLLLPGLGPVRLGDDVADEDARHAGSSCGCEEPAQARQHLGQGWGQRHRGEHRLDVDHQDRRPLRSNQASKRYALMIHDRPPNRGLGIRDGFPGGAQPTSRPQYGTDRPGSGAPREVRHEETRLRADEPNFVDSTHDRT